MNKEFRRVDNAHKTFNAMHENEKSGQLGYHLECDEVIKIWKNHMMHDDAGASHECSCQEKLLKKRETDQSKEYMSNADRSISLHAAKGSQNNEWKFSIRNAVKNDNISINDLAIKIRSACGSKDWDGGTSD